MSKQRMFIVKTVSKYPQKPLQTPASNAGPWLAWDSPGLRPRAGGMGLQPASWEPHVAPHSTTPPHTYIPQGASPHPGNGRGLPLPTATTFSCCPSQPYASITPSFLLSPSPTPSTPQASPSLLPQTAPEAESQFSASLPGAGKLETSQVRHGC